MHQEPLWAALKAVVMQVLHQLTWGMRAAQSNLRVLRAKLMWGKRTLAKELLQMKARGEQEVEALMTPTREMFHSGKYKEREVVPEFKVRNITVCCKGNVTFWPQYDHVNFPFDWSWLNLIQCNLDHAVSCTTEWILAWLLYPVLLNESWPDCFN